MSTEREAVGDLLCRMNEAPTTQVGLTWKAEIQKAIATLRTEAPAEKPALTDERIRELARECCLDWHRGYIPLFDGDETNRFAVFARAVLAAQEKGTQDTE